MPAPSYYNLLLLLIFPALIVCYLFYKNRFGKGNLAQVIQTDNCVVLVSTIYQSSGRAIGSSSRSRHYTRLTVLDVPTGKISGQTVLPDYYEVIMTVNGIVWMRLNVMRNPEKAEQYVFGFDTASCKKVCDQNTLKKKFNLSTGEVFHSMKMNVADGTIAIVSAAGFNYTFDCKELRAAHAAESIIPAPEGFAEIKALHAGHFQFKKLEKSERYELYCADKIRGQKQHFLNPVCLCATPTNSSTNTLVFLHQRDLTFPGEAYISTLTDGTQKVSNAVVLKTSAKQPIVAFQAGETNTHLIFATRNAVRDYVFGIEKISAQLCWITKS